MTPTPVGMRCPECSKQRTQVRTVRSLQTDPQLAYALIAVNVVAFLAELSSGGASTGGTVFREGALYGPLVADGEWWRIVTAGFLHASLLHILFNMFFIYFLGQLLEPALGKLRFGAVYGVSLLGGSLGALLLSNDSVTVGASGAAFGLLGAGIVAMRARGIDPMQSGLGMTLILNLGITLLIPGISIGGHLGGLVAGALVALVLTTLGERRRTLPAAYAAGVVIGVVLVVAAIALASSPIASIQ
jgi:membrane associated rhomboid family serine protease